MTIVCIAAACLAAPPSSADLVELMVQRGVPRSQVVVAFEATGEVERFVQQLRLPLDDASASAHRLFDSILAIKGRGELRGDRDNSPKQRLPKTATRVLAARELEPSKREVGCYELTVLYVAAARVAGLDAFGVVPRDLGGTGQIGHVMAGVRTHVGKPILVFDLQNERLGSAASVRELDDLELAAHHYNHLGASLFLGGHIERALRAVDWALSLAPSNPSFLSNRAAILVASGEPVLAIAEAAFAVERAPAVAHFRFQLGRAHLAAGELKEAIAYLGQALALEPEFEQARRDLGWALWVGGDTLGAQRQLAQSGKSVESDIYRACMHAVVDDLDAARAQVRRGLVQHPKDESLEALADWLRGKGNATRFNDVIESAKRVHQGETGQLVLPLF